MPGGGARGQLTLAYGDAKDSSLPAAGCLLFIASCVCGLGHSFLSSGALPAVGPTVGAWCGGAWLLAVNLAGCRDWGPGLACQGPPFLSLWLPSPWSFSKYYSYGISVQTLVAWCLCILDNLVFPHCVRSLTSGLGDISLPESSESSGGRHSWKVLVCGNVCHTGMLIKPTVGVASSSEGKLQGCLLVGLGSLH